MREPFLVPCAVVAYAQTTPRDQRLKPGEMRALLKVRRAGLASGRDRGTKQGDADVSRGRHEQARGEPMAPSREAVVRLTGAEIRGASADAALAVAAVAGRPFRRPGKSRRAGSAALVKFRARSGMAGIPGGLVPVAVGAGVLNAGKRPLLRRRRGQGGHSGSPLLAEQP